MLNDTETTQDLLNYQVVADTAAQMIKESLDEPISIGISGNWGAGKSSLVKMIGCSLEDANITKDNENLKRKYVIVNFNAWLYQGYDDARSALLQIVADALEAETKKNTSTFDKCKVFFKRVNWFKALIYVTKATKIAGNIISGNVSEAINTGTETIEEASKDIFVKGSIPEHIDSLRQDFQEALKELNIHLVVLVDDLDRCLPDIAISTLEAIRLLLFIPRTAFIIAADEHMIKSAVRHHFGNDDLDEALVTSYFDKLIQVPIRVPRLGISEVKGYIILLLSDLAYRQGRIMKNVLNNARDYILKKVKMSWKGVLSRTDIEEAFGNEKEKVTKEIDIAEQISYIMVTADYIAGNPRLIKRFLNNLQIVETIAQVQGMNVSFEELVKIQLFERCASPEAFNYLAMEVGKNINGYLECLNEFEKSIENGEDIENNKHLDISWKSPFVYEWLKLKPKLADTDLRPLLYLSRNTAMSHYASYDVLSEEGRSVMDALARVDTLTLPVIERIKRLSENEVKNIFHRIERIVKKEWESNIVIGILHISLAFPNMSNVTVPMLRQMPTTKLFPALISILHDQDWAQFLLEQWDKDKDTPKAVKNAIAIKRKEKK